MGARTGLVERLKQNAPAGFFDSALMVLAVAYRTAKGRASGEFDDAEASYFEPHLRRALVESDMAGLATRIVGVSARRVRTGAPSHRRFEIPGFAFTIARVRQAGDLVRHAAHRGFYAQSNLDLFSTPEETNRPIYAILLHGGRERLEFARVVFPDSELKGYVDYLDLFAEYPLTAEAIRGSSVAPEEVVEERLDVRLRPAASRRVEKESA